MTSKVSHLTGKNRIDVMVAVLSLTIAAATISSWADACTVPAGIVYPAGISHGCHFSHYMHDSIRGFSIYLPPEYAANTTKRLPVIYFLHGVGDDEYRWAPSSNPYSMYSTLGTQIVNAVKGGKVLPFIYVFLNGGWGSWYTDNGPNDDMPGDSAESYIIKELIPHIDSTYRTIAAKTGRSIEGFSMGGNGCLRLAYKYPEMFASVVSYACSIHPDRQDPNVIVRQNQARIRGNLRIFLRAGSNDQGNVTEQNTHKKILDSLNIACSIDVIQGAGHSMDEMYSMGNPYGAAGVTGLNFHPASWSATGTDIPRTARATPRATPVRGNLLALSGFRPELVSRNYADRVFDIRGSRLGMLDDAQFGASSSIFAVHRIIVPSPLSDSRR